MCGWDAGRPLGGVVTGGVVTGGVVTGGGGTGVIVIGGILTGGVVVGGGLVAGGLGLRPPVFPCDGEPPEFGVPPVPFPPVETTLPPVEAVEAGGVAAEPLGFDA